MNEAGTALLSAAMQTDLSTSQVNDPSAPYSNLEVSTNPIATHQLVVGHGADGRPVHYYVPISDLIKKQALFPEVVAAENYDNPAPVVRPNSRDGKIVHYGDDKILTSGDFEPSQVIASPYDAQSPVTPTVCGIRRRTFCWIAVAVGLVVFIVAVGGGVGGYYANRGKSDAALGSEDTTEEPERPSSTLIPSPLPLEDYDMSISAVMWLDGGVNNYRVFFQPTYLNQTQVIQSSWSSDNKTWTVLPITESGKAVKPNAPISAVAGFPHTDSYREYMVNNVYFPSAESTLIERQSPFKRRLGQWGDNDVTYHNVEIGSNSSICAYWWQNFEFLYMILVTFYQQSGANTLTIRSYAEAGPDVEDEKKHDWRNTTKSLNIQDGSPMAVAPRSAGPNIMMYMAALDGTLKQVPIDLETDEFGVETATDYKLAPHSPLCISTEDNRNYYSEATMPECARTTDPLTHLILFATEDRKSLKLLSWNCTDGFIDATSRIQNLLKPDRKYLSVATTSGSNLTFVDHRAYVLYDDGKDEPTMEEWQIPDSGKTGGKDQNGSWSLKGRVPITT